MRRWVRDTAGWLSLALAAAAVTLLVLRPDRRPAGWVGLAAVVLAAIAWLTPAGRHRYRTALIPGGGAHARLSILAEARANGRPRPEPPPGPRMARRIEDAAIVMAAAAIPRGAHARPAVWGVPPDCPDPPRCGRSPFCPGDRPGCLDPAPFNPLGRIILAPGKIPVRAVGRHERPEREGTDDNDST